jgi:Calpain family cysteine protease
VCYARLAFQYEQARTRTIPVVDTQTVTMCTGHLLYMRSAAVAHTISSSSGTIDTYSSDSSATCIWGPLIEKAYAKLHGCYENISKGDIAYGLMDCTGAPVTTHSIEHSNSLQNNSQTDAANTWQLLLQAQRDGSLVACYRSVAVTLVAVLMH